MTKNKTIVNYLVVIFFVIVLITNLRFIPANQSAAQAYSWIHGKLELIENYVYVDNVIYKGHTYWTLGPFPSLLLVPIIFLDHSTNYSQNILNIILVSFIFYACFTLAIKAGYKTEDALYLALAFCTGSVFLQAALWPKSWHIAHTVTTALFLLAFIENSHQNRPTIIGILFACILATRPTAFLGVLFFAWNLFSNSKSYKSKFWNLTLLIYPIAVMFIILSFYNYARFGNYFETGYQHLANRVYIPLLENSYAQSINHSLFSISNIHRNFLIYFANILKANIYGINVSAFIVCLPFLFCLRADLNLKKVKHALINSLLILVVILSYYWPGWEQYGPRYLNDLMPFLYITLLYSFKNFKLSQFFKLMVIYSMIFNIVLFSAVYI